MKKCTGAVISWLIQQQAITEEDREIYTYAVDNMVFLLIPLAMVLVIGGIIHTIRQGIVMIIPFMLLRKFSGGYHAKTLFRCMIISCLLLFPVSYTHLTLPTT